MKSPEVAALRRGRLTTLSAAVALLLLGTVWLGAAQQPGKKIDPPGPIDQAEYEKLIKNLPDFKSDFQAVEKHPAGAGALAAKLVLLAKGTKSEVGRYIALRLARELALVAGESKAALEIIERLNAEYVVNAAALRKQVERVATEAEAFKQALAVLAKNHDDRPANFVVGKYLCLGLGDWDRGLPYLTKGDKLAYRLIARNDLQRPKTTDRQRELGDDWWELAQAEAGPLRARLQERAAHWYQTALPGLKAEAVARVKQRIEAAQAAGTTTEVPVLEQPEKLDSKEYLGVLLHEGDPVVKAVTMRFGLHLPEQPDPGTPGAKKRLTYHPAGYSNNTCLKVEGVEQLLGLNGGQWQVRKEALGGGRLGIRSVWVTDDLPIKVTQIIELVRGGQTRKLDTCRVLYVLENTSKKRDYKVGLRFLLDTFIGTNDGSPFIIPGDKELCETQRDLKGEQVPAFVQALENAKRLADPGTVATLQLKLGTGVEAPARVTLGAWPDPGSMVPGAAGPDTLWNVPLFSMKQLMPADSAVAMYWDEKPLAPGAKRTVGFSYGLGNYAADKVGDLGLIVGGGLHEGGTVEVVALVAGAKAGQNVTLKAAQGLEIVGAATQAVAPPPVGADNALTPVTWKVLAKRKGLVQFTVTSGTGTSVSQDVRLLDKPAAPAQPVDVEALIKQELEKLQGTWYVASSQHKGKNLLPPKVAMKVVIVGQTMTVHRPAELGGPETSYYKINPTEEPKRIDIFPPKPGFQEAGIYRWQGDQLQLCLSERQKVVDATGKVIANAESFRPKTFDAKEGVLLLLSRTNPQGKDKGAAAPGAVPGRDRLEVTPILTGRGE